MFFNEFFISFFFPSSCWISSDNNLIWIFVSFVVVIEVVSETNLKENISHISTLISLVQIANKLEYTLSGIVHGQLRKEFSSIIGQEASGRRKIRLEVWKYRTCG